MNPVPLVLGGIEIVQHAGPIRQSYEPIGGKTVARLSGGVGVSVTHWTRWRTMVSGSGDLDPGLDMLDYTQPLELLCVKPRGVDGVGPLIGLPAGIDWRTDEAPWGLALVGTRWTETDLVIQSGVAELTPVAGAQRYRFCYLPRLIVVTDGPTAEFDHGTGRYDWTLKAEQV